MAFYWRASVTELPHLPPSSTGEGGAGSGAGGKQARADRQRGRETQMDTGTDGGKPTDYETGRDPDRQVDTEKGQTGRVWGSRTHTHTCLRPHDDDTHTQI